VRLKISAVKESMVATASCVFPWAKCRSKESLWWWGGGQWEERCGRDTWHGVYLRAGGDPNILRIPHLHLQQKLIILREIDISDVKA